jgi:hypothetical protein
MSEYRVGTARIGWLIAGVAAAAHSAATLAQETTAPATTETPAATEAPAAGEPVGEAADGTVDVETHPGHPTRTSASGHEYEAPGHPGIFSWSPASLIIPPIQEGTDWLKENARLDIGFRAAFGFQQATTGPGNRTAASQDYRVYATFNAINWEEGKQGWAGNVYTRFEFRDKIGDVAPYFLNNEIGTLATTTYGQDEHAPAIVQLYWEQFLFDGAFRLRVGKLDPDDYFNLGRFADDYRYFDNTLFSAFPASNHPSGGLGFNLQWYASPEWTVTAGLSDVQGRKTLSGFNTIGDGNFFYGVDVTYSPEIEGFGRGNYRVGYEYRDSVPGEKPEDSTVYLNIDQEIVENLAPFLRTSWSTGRSTGVKYTVALGLGIDDPFGRKGDAFGIGAGIVVANDKDTANDMEIPTEIFYRWQVTSAIQAMLGYQIIIDPVNNPDEDVIGVFQARWVIDF